MKIKAKKDTEQVTEQVASFSEFCKLMNWTTFDPKQSDLVYKGWRISIEKEIAPNVWIADSKPDVYGSANRTAKLEQRYTESLRPFGKTCKSCKFRLDDLCMIGTFKVKMNGGCNGFE